MYVQSYNQGQSIEKASINKRESVIWKRRVYADVFKISFKSQKIALDAVSQFKRQEGLLLALLVLFLILGVLSLPRRYFCLGRIFIRGKITNSILFIISSKSVTKRFKQKFREVKKRPRAWWGLNYCLRFVRVKSLLRYEWQRSLVAEKF